MYAKKRIAITVIVSVLWLTFAATAGLCDDPLSEQDTQKIDKFIHIILTDPQNPALYEMVERVTEEDPKQLAPYLESYFNEKIKASEEPPLHYHLIRLHFRFRQMTKEQWPSLTEELEKIKTDVEKLEDQNFQKLYDRLMIQSLEQIPDRKEDLAKLYRTQVLPHWKEYAVNGQETLFKAIFQFYFDESDPKTAHWAQTIFNQLLDRFEGSDLPFLHLTLISDAPAPFSQKRSLIRLVEERIRDRSLHLQTCWQRLKWELNALRREELFMTLPEWQKAVKESFEEYLSLIQNFQPNHWLRSEMEPALLSYLSLGAEWNESQQKSYFEETEWRAARKEAIRSWLPFVSKLPDASVEASQETEQIPLPLIARARLILMKNPDQLKLTVLEESLATSTFSVQEFYILYRLFFDKEIVFKFKLLTRYLELLKEQSRCRGIIHEEKMPLLSTLLADRLLNDEMFDLLLEIIAKTELTPKKLLTLYSTCLEHPFLKEKTATQILQRLNTLNIAPSTETIQEIVKIHPTFLKGMMLTQITEMIHRKNLTLTEQLALFPALLAQPNLPEDAIIWLLQELGKTKSDLAIATVKEFLMEQPVGIIEAAAQALIDIGRASVPALIEVLKQNPCIADIAIIDALVQIGEEAVPLLIEAYQEAFKIEEERLRDDDPRTTDVQFNILHILKQINSTAAKNFLVSIAMSSPKELLEKDIHAVLCYSALEALVEIDHDLGVEFLIQHIESAAYPTSHKTGVIHIFTQMDPENLANYLMKKLKAKESEISQWVSQLILEVLTDPNSPAASEVLLSCLLRSKENRVRVPIVDVLTKIGNEITIPKLIDALSDSDVDFRKHLISALASMQGRSFPYLIEALSHSNPLIWEGAQESLHLMGTINTSYVRTLNEIAKDSKNETEKARIQEIIKKLNQSGSF